MSENIPESIPTSSDPRSKRPIKKRALSPKSQVASQVEALFSKPDQHIPLSSTSTSLAHSSSVPEIVANVQGSSAGAGSGEFHVYKASRRREYERLRAMDEEVKEEEGNKEWEREKSEREKRDEERTRKNREKREKLKRRKGKGGDDGKSAAIETKAGVKARMHVTRGNEENGDGDEHRNGNGKVMAVEPQDLVIHDDD